MIQACSTLSACSSEPAAYRLSKAEKLDGATRLVDRSTLLRVHLLLVATKRAYHRTTNSHHRFRFHPNLLKSEYKATKPEQLWVPDITYCMLGVQH